MRQYYVIEKDGEEDDYFATEMLKEGVFGGEIPDDAEVLIGSLNPKRLISQLTPEDNKTVVVLTENADGTVSLRLFKNIGETKRYLGHKTFQRKGMSSYDILTDLVKRVD